jgi:hypothetical protein
MTNEKDQEFESVDERFEKEFTTVITSDVYSSKPVGKIFSEFVLPEQVKYFLHEAILADRKIQKEKILKEIEKQSWEIDYLDKEILELYKIKKIIQNL